MKSWTLAGPACGIELFVPPDVVAKLLPDAIGNFHLYEFCGTRMVKGHGSVAFYAWKLALRAERSQLMLEAIARGTPSPELNAEATEAAARLCAALP